MDNLLHLLYLFFYLQWVVMTCQLHAGIYNTVAALFKYPRAVTIDK